jgi:hypothetical protein
MADERFEIQYATSQTMQASRPCIAVAIDKLEVDLHGVRVVQR